MVRRGCVVAALLLVGSATPARAQFVVNGASVPSVSVGCVWQVQSVDPVVVVCGTAGSGNVSKTGSITSGYLTKWNSDGVITNSIISESGSVATVGGTLNATTLQVGGVSINVPGALGNVCYVSTACALTGTNFSGIPAAAITNTAVTLSGSQTISGAKTFSTGIAVSAATGSIVVTSTTGTNSSYVQMVNGSGGGLFGINNSAGTDVPAAANATFFYGYSAYGIDIVADHASGGDIRLKSRGVTALTLGAGQTAAFSGDISTAATKKIYLDGGGNSYITETSSDVVRIYAGGTDTVIIKNDGLILGIIPTTASAANMVYNTGTGYVERSTSSLRWKHDIENVDYDTALATVMGLRPITYRGKTDADQRRYAGFLAEETMRVNPLLATYDEGGETGTPNYVTYDRVPVYLVPVVQRQQVELATLKAEVARLAAIVGRQ